MSTSVTSPSVPPRIWHRLSALITLLCAASTVFAQLEPADLRLPISLVADSTDYDGKNSMLMFKGLRMTQGDFVIEADEGRATKLDFEDSVWRFSGHVVIDTENAHIECDSADLRFIEHQLQIATINGLPATVELQRPETTDITYAQAYRIDYNFELGVIEFSENATITEAGNQISSNYLVYNIAEQRINAQSSGSDGERVKIIYTPKQQEAAETLPDTDAISDDETDPVSGEEAIAETDGDNAP